MTEQQIPMLAGKLVEHQSFFRTLSVEDAQWAIQHPQETIALFVAAVTNRAEKTVQKLEYVTTIPVAGAKSFVAKKYFNGFEVNTSNDVEVKTSHIGSMFQEYFMGKTENDVKPADIKIQRLLINSKDPPIIAELGDTHETTLTYLWQALEIQGHGQRGKLLTDGYANVFYIRDDVDGTLWAVCAYWCGGGWFLNANSVEHPRPWSAVFQVCSR